MLQIVRSIYLDIQIQIGSGSVANRKSTLGCCFTLGSSMISWIGKKQSCVALSTAEVEYVAACATSREAVWL
jgi:hypothetical protein